MALYQHSQARENCGFGLIAHLEGAASHRIVRTAINGLDRMQHRGGISADGKTGDGCGLLMQKPDSFFRAIAEENGWNLAKKYGVGMIFLSQDPVKAALAKKIIAQEIGRETLTLVAWRTVPVDSSVLGPLVIWLIKKDTMPFVDSQGKEALNFNLSMFIYACAAGLIALGVTTLWLAYSYRWTAIRWPVALAAVAGRHPDLQ